ncbi:hypothetical protein ACYULU_05455, partial [Breznakiellaceae bacterium SP9]
MKKRFVFGALLVLTTLFMAGCQKLIGDKPESSTTPTAPTGSIKYSKEFWGEWLRMDANETWYITSSAIEIDGQKSSKTLTLNKQSDRVIKVVEGGREYYLYASRIVNAHFTGKIAGFQDGSRSGIPRLGGSGLGGIKVFVHNLKDKVNELTTTTDSNGKFTADGIIPGDEHVVTPEGGTPTIVLPRVDGDDVGTITIAQGVNFKASITPQSAATNMSELYEGRTYHFDIVIKNTGDQDCTAATCQIDFGTGLNGSGAGLTTLGTIESGKTKTIPVSIASSLIQGEYEFKKINVTITDTVQQKTWEDSVSLRFIPYWEAENSTEFEALLSKIRSSTETNFTIYITSNFSLAPVSLLQFVVIFILTKTLILWIIKQDLWREHEMMKIVQANKEAVLEK